MGVDQTTVVQGENHLGPSDDQTLLGLVWYENGTNMVPHGTPFILISGLRRLKAVESKPANSANLHFRWLMTFGLLGSGGHFAQYEGSAKLNNAENHPSFGPVILS